MKNITLFGKKYLDTLISVNNIMYNETNTISKISKKIGGVNNISDLKFQNIKIKICFSGKKKAYILNDKENSSRTSFVYEEEKSYLDNILFKEINDTSDWVHICYLDDLECIEKINNLKKPFSIDFCTNQDRNQYKNTIDIASVCFDSRERKSLYKEINTKTPIIFHDEKGIEIVIKKETIFSFENIPIKGLEVNGAGDIFAALFLDFYQKLDIYESSKKAMFETTNLLVQRGKNEKI